MAVRFVTGLVGMFGLLTAAAGLLGQAFCDESCTGDEHLVELGGLAVATAGLARAGGDRLRSTGVALALVAVALLLKGTAGLGLALAIVAAVAALGSWLLRKDPPVHLEAGVFRDRH